MNLKKIVPGWNVRKNVRQTQSTSNYPEEPSLDLTFDLTQKCIDFQLGQVDTLDAKADSAQVSATTLVGAGLVLEAVLLPLNSYTPIRIAQIISLTPLLVSYIVVMVSANNAYKVESYKRVPAPSAFLDEDYLTLPEKTTKDKILNAMEYVFKENQKRINKKTDLINCAITARTVEALMLVLVLIIQVILTLFTK